ncbi:MAG: helix-turn-helix domain-containing protein [Archangium sp.]
MTAAISFDQQLRKMAPVAAPEREHDAVEALHDALEASLTRARRSAAYRLVGPDGKAVEVPASLFHVLVRASEVLARGDSITLVPVSKALTTQQAAQLLNVSRQYLVRLLDEGRVPFTKTGKHRRVRIEDVLAFKAKRDAPRADKLRELTELTESFGGYDKEAK